MDPREAHPLLDALFRVDRGMLPLSTLDEHDREHLHALCPECARQWAEFPERWRQRFEEVDGVEAAENAWLQTPEMQTLLEGERNAARAQVEQLLNLDPEERLGKVKRAYKQYRTPAFVERVIVEAKVWIRHDANESLALLTLAEVALPRIRSRYGERYLHRLGLRLLAHQGNALRVLGDLRAAGARFKEVGRRLTRIPTGDRALLGELASLEGSLRFTQRRLEEAGALLERAVGYFRDAGDGLDLAKVQIQRGMALRVGGEPAAAIPYYEAAAAALDLEAEPQTAYNALHNLALCLCEVDQPAAAAEVLAQCEKLAEVVANPTTASQLLWLEGRVALADGDSERALDRLREARHAYAERGLAHDVGLVCLDLAAAHLARGETAEVKRLAEQVARPFARRGVAREAARAAKLFYDAARAEAMTLDLIAETRRALLRFGRRAR